MPTGYRRYFVAKPVGSFFSLVFVLSNLDGLQPKDA